MTPPPGYYTLDAAGLIQYVNDYKHVSFAELKRVFPAFFGGDFGLYASLDKNFVFWLGLTDAGSEIINDCLNTRKLFAHPCTSFWGHVPMVYLIDGCILNIPLAKKNIRYKKPHWVPVVLNTFPWSPNNQKRQRMSP